MRKRQTVGQKFMIRELFLLSSLGLFCNTACKTSSESEKNGQASTGLIDFNSWDVASDQKIWKCNSKTYENGLGLIIQSNNASNAEKYISLEVYSLKMGEISMIYKTQEPVIRYVKDANGNYAVESVKSGVIDAWNKSYSKIEFKPKETFLTIKAKEKTAEISMGALKGALICQ